MTGLLLSSHIGVWALAFRGALLAKGGKKEEVESWPELALVAHFGRGALSAPEQMKEALVVLFMIRIVGHSERDGGKEGKEVDMETAKLIRRLMRIAQFNRY